MVAKKGLSVRETEALVRRTAAVRRRRPLPRQRCRAAHATRTCRALEQELADKLGAKVLIQHGSGGKGKLVISYNSLDELDGILAHIQ